MATKKQEMQAFIRHYVEQTGKVEWDMHDVAALAEKKGWKMPKPQTALDILAKQFSDAAREETKQDAKTGRPYRVYHAFIPDGQGQGTLWFDIDNAKVPRKYMHKSAIMRRDQMVGDALQLTLDLDHWHRTHADEERIDIPLDLQPDRKSTRLNSSHER